MAADCKRLTDDAMTSLCAGIPAIAGSAQTPSQSAALRTPVNDGVKDGMRALPACCHLIVTSLISWRR